ncbi:Tat pathway signal protein [Achromobacter sp. UMC46]|nr:Tat pathway signal protein [Achromobacter sp. UMC46]
MSRRFSRRSVIRAMACMGVLCAYPATGQAKQLVPFFGRSARRPPIRLVVPFAAGGTTDIVARLLAARLADALGQPVIVDNRAGAGGNIGVSSVAKAEPDGSTLLIVSSSFITNAAVAGARASYDAVRDFSPISLVVTSPDVIVVRADSGIDSLSALLGLARQTPGARTYATPGNGNSVHLAAELLWQRALVDLMHVPYSGAAPAVMAVAGGHVDCAFAALPAARAAVAAGKLRAVAVGSTQRWPELPGVPTIAEAGFPDFRSETIQALFAPAGTPAALVQRVSKAVGEVLANDAVQRQFQDQGFRCVASSPDQLAARIAQELPVWTVLAANAGIAAD